MSIAGKHIDLFMNMLSIPAISRNEDKRADLLESYFREVGVPVSRVKNNLVAGEGIDKRLKDGRKTILLNSHIDTVPPSDDWATDPFKPVMNNDRITGLGSNDAGGSVIAMIGAYEMLMGQVNDDLNIILVLSAEEEVSGQNGISSLIPVLGDIDGAIIGEPTKMQPAVAERGLMVIDALVRGKSGHAARGEGENAIYKALKNISEIENITYNRKSKWLPEPSAQVTMIESGTKHNVVPDICKYVIDVRSNDQYSNRELLDILKKRCQGELVPRSLRLNASNLSEDHFLNMAVKENELIPFGSQTLSDMAVLPYPAIKIGPGDSARSHTADEYILVSEIEKGIAGYISFIKSIMHVV